MVTSNPESAQVATDLQAFIERSTPDGPQPAVKPGHRVKFHWPPHPVSYKYHVLASDWTGSAELKIHGETLAVSVARTPSGVFGRCHDLWVEAKGESEAAMLRHLREAAEPLFERQFGVARCLERDGRFKDHINELPPSDLVKLLYCPDRDVASEACTEIETHASLHVFTPALISILRDDRHPQRRSAQWCVLDLFEDLPTFADTPELESEALEAMKDLIWNAPDDYARTTFKAGVVLGGHLPHLKAGRMLLACLDAPSKYGRRSAIHGLFHTVEWVADLRDAVLAGLRQVAEKDAEPLLREFAKSIAEDIAHGSYDHLPEPVFDEER